MQSLKNAQSIMELTMPDLYHFYAWKRRSRVNKVAQVKIIAAIYSEVKYHDLDVRRG